MNLQKWINVYNSILRLRFYAYLETYNPSVLKDIDNSFQDFVDRFNQNPNKDEVRFFGGQMLMGLSYLILVRTNEYINSDLTPEEAEIVLKIENWRTLIIESYDDLISHYCIDVKILRERKSNGELHYSNDQEKLQYFIRKLRNAVSHYHYENPTNESIKLTDINPNNNQTEMECLFKYSDFLIFCMDFGTVINDTLFRLNKKE